MTTYDAMTDDQLVTLFLTHAQAGRDNDADAVQAVLDTRDAADRAAAPPSLLHAALWYARHDVPVFPLRPGGKQPLPGSRGFKDATTDPDRIHAWWDGPGADRNIGTPTGHRFDVIDLDGPAALQYMYGGTTPLADRLPVLATVKTPRAGGQHVYVPATGRGNTATADGVDYRGTGGYVVIPPSRVTADGHTRAYYWQEANGGTTFLTSKGTTTTRVVA